MARRRSLEIGAVVWAIVGLWVGLAVAGASNADAKVLVYSAAILGPAAALIGAVALERHRDRSAGALFLISVVTPTVFAWVLNVPALIVGVWLLAAPRSILRPHPSG